MHSDVLEVFIIANSVPVLHLNQENKEDSDSVLKAGRISVQDMLGEEATGETLQKEVYEDSTIVYGRTGGILVTIRVTNQMSQGGVDILLKNVLRVIQDNKEVIFNSFGDRGILNNLINKLHRVLGEKLPSNPLYLAKINDITENYFKKYSFIDRVGLLTEESWVVNISERQDRPLTLSDQKIWKNAVEILHKPLGLQSKGAIIKDDDSVWWLKPIFYKNSKSYSGISWWALVVQNSFKLLTQNKADETLPNFNDERNISSDMFKILELSLTNDLFSQLSPLIQEMLEREVKNLDRQGIFGQVFTFIETIEDEFLEILIEEDRFLIYDTVTEEKISPKARYSVFLLSLLEYFKLGQNDQILNQKPTVFIQIEKTELIKSFVQVLNSFNSSDFEIFQIDVSINSDLIDLSDLYQTLNNVSAHTINLFSAGQVNVEFTNNITILDQINEEAFLNLYDFLIIHGKNNSLAFLTFERTFENCEGIFTIDSNLIELISQRVSQLPLL